MNRNVRLPIASLLVALVWLSIFPTRGLEARPETRSHRLAGISGLGLDVTAVCAASGSPRMRARQPEPGNWLWFDPEPVTLSPRFKGTLRLRNTAILGDVEELELQLTPGSPIRRFARREVVQRDGVTLSMFDVALGPDDYRELLSLLPIRFDCLDPGCPGVTSFPFRMRPGTIPKARVVRIDDRVQYSSHVVNIVAPYETEFEHLPAGDRFFSPSDVAELFYRHFSDSYEELAMTPSRAHASPSSGAAAERVYNTVEGIAVEPVDSRAGWGGSQTLRHVTMTFRGDPIWNHISLHETGHQWGFYFDLFDAAGIEPRGSSVCLGRTATHTIHQPLLADQPSFLSACLASPLRIERRAGSWRVAEALAPLFFHPLQAYAMGLVTANEVPPLYLRERQDRPTDLSPGAAVQGPWIEVTIDDIVARYGVRVGPAVPATWRRATIVVSPDKLLGARDLSWYNFFASRIADPDLTGIEGLDLTPSMETATAGAVDLRTEIRPRSGPRIRADFEVSHPQLGRRDLPGLKLRRKLGTHYTAGRRYKISGRVLAPGDHRQISFTLGSSVFTGEIGPGGRFEVELVPRRRDRGQRWLIAALGSPAEIVGQVAPVTVD